MLGKHNYHIICVLKRLNCSKRLTHLNLIKTVFENILLFPICSDGENTEGGKDLRQQAGEIMACEYEGKRWIDGTLRY